LSDVDPRVYAYGAEIFALYYRRKDDLENFYKSSLTFLAYTNPSELTVDEKKQWSTKMGMAVLLGKNIFNITELLDKEILHSLVGTDFEWLYDLLQTLGRGLISDFAQAIQKHTEMITRFPAILSELTYLEQKVRIIAFLELLFRQGKDERQVSFKTITEACVIEKSDVELLVMKAMSLELIKGTIDEVAESVQVDWVLPRYLNKDHLKILYSRIDEWGNKMDNVIKLVENGAEELLQQ